MTSGSNATARTRVTPTHGLPLGLSGYLAAVRTPAPSRAGFRGVAIGFPLLINLAVVTGESPQLDRHMGDANA
jgi:hypothetical protein